MLLLSQNLTGYSPLPILLRFIGPIIFTLYHSEVGHIGCIEVKNRVFHLKKEPVRELSTTKNHRYSICFEVVVLNSTM